MFSFFGFGGEEEEADQENVPPHQLEKIDEASSRAEAGSETTKSLPSLPQKQSSDSSPVLVEAEDHDDDGVLVKSPTPPDEEHNAAASTAGKSLLDDESEEDEPATRTPVEELFDDDDIDLELVERYDSTFNQFCSEHPKFLMKNPDLVHSLRVSKLQKLLSNADHMENELIQQLETIEASKAEMESVLYQQLMDATRKKAAREIHLQSQLADLQYRTKEIEARLKWDLVLQSESRAKKQYNQRQYLKNHIVSGDRLDLLSLVPDGSEFQDLRDAILAPGSASQDHYLQQQGAADAVLTPQQEQDLRQFQVDNAILNAEVNTLKKGVDYAALAAKKNAWVESVLVRMDPKTLKKLKTKHQKKWGVAL